MKKVLAAAVITAVITLGGVPGFVPAATVQAASGWRLAGVCRSYEEACRKADQLEACGYDTMIKKQNGRYYVYCK